MNPNLLTSSSPLARIRSTGAALDALERLVDAAAMRVKEAKA